MFELESEGFVLRGQFTPDSTLEWCERRLLARINRYTIKTLRAEIEPVSPADFMRFLLDWQGVTRAPKPEGSESLAAVIAQVKENIDAYTPERYGVGKTGVLRTTGPIAYTRGLLKNQSGANYRIADIRDLGFQYSIFGTDQNTKFDHIKMFRNHYAFCTEPVVLGNFVNARGEVNASWGKIGRNEPCPCGSGKRFKHCHGAIR